MATKIINVLRNDKFEDILELFRNTPAKEVIFVLPKTCKSFNSEENFALLASESEEHDKTVLILSENQEINDLASSYNFGVLTSQQDDDEPEEEIEPVEEVADDDLGTPVDSSESIEHQDYGFSSSSKDEDNYSGDKDGELTYQPKDNSEDAVLVAAPKQTRAIHDIIGPNLDNSVSLKINKKTEKPLNLEVKKEFQKPIVREPMIEEPMIEEPMIEKPVLKPDMRERVSLDEIQNVWQSKREIPQKVYDGPAPGFKLPGFPVGTIVSKLSKKTLYLYGLGVVILFGFVLYISTGKAQIIIKPRAHVLDFSIIKIVASDVYSAVDLESKRIPGQLFSVDKKIEETFPATGEKDVVQKARGKITVYNEYGTTPQVLIATTRFESESGLIFRTLKTITVPGTTVQNGKITAGKIDVEVIADKAGDNYNIPADKFTIPAFKEKGDMDRYQKFYGTSQEAMKGGIVGKAKVVTEQDYVNAKKTVEEKIIAETEQELNTQATGLKILGLSAPAIKEITPSAQIDEAIDSFTVIGIAELSTVGFKESDLNDLIVKYVASVQNLEVFTDKLDIKFEDVKFNNDQKTLEFTIFIKGRAYSKIDTEVIITSLMGKGEDNIKDYIKGIESISSARVILSPFWVFKVPTNRERIEIKFEYE